MKTEEFLTIATHAKTATKKENGDYELFYQPQSRLNCTAKRCPDLEKEIGRNSMVFERVIRNERHDGVAYYVGFVELGTFYYVVAGMDDNNHYLFFSCDMIDDEQRIVSCETRTEAIQETIDILYRYFTEESPYRLAFLTTSYEIKGKDER